MEAIEGCDQHAVRLGLRMVHGLAQTDAARIIAARADQPFDSVDDLWRRSGVPAASLVELAEADAFLSSLKLQRCDALWAEKPKRQGKHENPLVTRTSRTAIAAGLPCCYRLPNVP